MAPTPSRRKPCAAALPCVEHNQANDPAPGEGSSGEEDDGSSYVLAKRKLPQRQGSDDDSDDYEEEEEDLESDSDSAEGTTEPAPPLGSPSPETSQMKRKAQPPTELRDSKRKAAAASMAELAAPAPATPEVADKGKAPVREVQLEEKSAACRHLWRELEALDAEWPDLLLKEAFLKIDDAMARKLEKKIKMQRAPELKLLSRQIEIDKDISKVLMALLN